MLDKLLSDVESSMAEDAVIPINLKMCLLGNGYVGKTSIRRSYLGQGFTTEYLGTLGADFAIKNIIYTNLSIRFQIWDIAGQPRFNQIRKSFFVGSQAAMIIYDITDTEMTSFDAVINWTEELWENNGKGKVPILLIGNKIDLRSGSQKTISYDEGKALAEKISQKTAMYVPFIETSAKTGENIDLAIHKMAEEFIRYFKIKVNH